MTPLALILLAVAAIVAGYGLFFAVLKILPHRLRADHSQQREDILSYARRQAQDRHKAEVERLQDEFQLLTEQAEADVHERQEDRRIREEELVAQEASLQAQEGRLAKLTKELEAQTQRTETQKQAADAKAADLQALRGQLKIQLEVSAKVDGTSLAKSLQEQMIETRQIDCQKALRFLDDELSTSAKRRAERVLARAMSRYAPEFYWPKSNNFVEVLDPKILDRLAGAEAQLLVDVAQAAEIEAELLSGPDVAVPIVKLAGGAGINREAVRLTLTELFTKSPGAWAKFASTYDRHRATLEQQAIKLGRLAMREIGLTGIHPEVQKLVGYLNWRTSYRQNQWYHTVEVAKLAGIIAHELGIDADAAKRVGLLHDIGKAIDYRIEGSHAVISGDYADRFGERRLICDTVMSHHNDLVVETPLAFVLKTADTLSGARPGARVNLEEGYQMRLSGIESCVRSFPGVVALSIMNGAREVHVEVNHKRVHEGDLERLSQGIAKKIQEEVAFPGEIKILVSRRFEATAVA